MVVVTKRAATTAGGGSIVLDPQSFDGGSCWRTVHELLGARACRPPFAVLCAPILRRSARGGANLWNGHFDSAWPASADVRLGCWLLLCRAALCLFLASELSPSDRATNEQSCLLLVVEKGRWSGPLAADCAGWLQAGSFAAAALSPVHTHGETHSLLASRAPPSPSPFLLSPPRSPCIYLSRPTLYSVGAPAAAGQDMAI